MASRTPDNRTRSSGRYLYVLGLPAMAIGLLLMLPVAGLALRPAGAVMLLIGLVLTGSYFIRRLKAEISSDNLGPEPTWAKPVHGAAGYGSLLARDKTAPLHDAALPHPAPRPSELPDAPAGRPLSPAEAPQIAAPASPAPTANFATGSFWEPAVFDHLSTQQFDALCEALLAQGGFETRGQSHGPSGGITVWLYSRNARGGKDNPVAVAWCRHGLNLTAGVREIQPLLELMGAHQMARGTCATLSSFTEHTRQFARLKGINLLDRAALLALIARRTPDQQQTLACLVRDKPSSELHPLAIPATASASLRRTAPASP